MSDSSIKTTVRFIIGSLDIGGAEKHLSEILPELYDGEITPIVITLTHKGILAKDLEKKGINVLAPDKTTRFIQRIPLISRILGPFFTLMYLISVFNKFPAKSTCFYLPSSYCLGMLAVIFSGDNSRTVMFRRSLNDYQKKRPLIAYLERQFHKKVHTIVGNSRAVVRQLVEEESVPAEKVKLIYNGANISGYLTTEARSKVRNKFGIDDGTVVLCIIANLIPYKGHRDLIEALALISDKINYPWLLLSIGTGIQARPDLVKFVKVKKLTQNVRWLGQRRDIAEILSISDIGLLVSYQEGFSNAILEGMAAGLPMIVTDVGGNSEAIKNGESGLVVPPQDPEALSGAILHLINDKNLAKRYGDSARERVQQSFSLDKCVNSYNKLFQEII